MFALNLLSETNELDLSWLLWLVLALFAIIVFIGWMVSNKKGDEIAPAKKEEAAPVAPATPDVLKKLEGIGPKVEQILNEAGITTYAELAKSDVKNLRELLAVAKLQMMNPDSWAEQAGLADKGEWDALEKLQDELKGGRRV